MDEMLKPNSNRYKEEQKAVSAQTEEKRKFEKVVSGTVRTKKKSGFSKFKDELISDNVPSIKTYIIKDVLIPMTKRTISEIVDMFLYGGSRDRRPTTIGSKVSYGSFYNEPRSKNAEVPRIANSYNYDDVVFNSRGEAEEVLTLMEEALDRYEFVSVGDLYDLAGISGSSYTDNKYGWTDLKTADIVRLRDGGYMIKFPKAMPRPR